MVYEAFLALSQLNQISLHLFHAHSRTPRLHNIKEVVCIKASFLWHHTPSPSSWPMQWFLWHLFPAASSFVWASWKKSTSFYPCHHLLVVAPMYLHHSLKRSQVGEGDQGGAETGMERTAPGPNLCWCGCRWCAGVDGGWGGGGERGSMAWRKKEKSFWCPVTNGRDG